MIHTDFSEFMKYTNKAGDNKIKLKCEKRTTLEPYMLKSKSPINRGAFGSIYCCVNKNNGEEYENYNEGENNH